MTQTPHPPRCHYDRRLGERVTRHHTDDCHDPQDCTGCQPCVASHCSVCGREHLDDAHPNTCPDCVSSIREDLDELARLCRQLRSQAAYAANDGRPWAAAPIPGANAMVLVGPSVTPDQLRSGRSYDDERRGDPVPPLGVLAHWEDTWRRWLGHTTGGRASIGRAVDYLDAQLTMIAQAGLRLDPTSGAVTTPPDFAEFARALGRLRAQLEATLHDEQAPDRGVECFECGARLVRRHRDPNRCTHQTPARDWFGVLFTYPEIPIRPTEVAAARLPCPRCDQGGLADPTPGISWECPSCRMTYSPGEYATAVRRDLLDSDDGDGWTDIVLAADAASTLTGRLVPASTVRKWMDRGVVAGCCLWRPGQFWGQRLVYWPDVAERATTGGTRRAS